MTERYINGIVYDDVTGEKISVPDLKGNQQAVLPAASASTKVPATATAPGMPGEIRYNTTHAYFCVAKNVWRRAAIATW